MSGNDATTKVWIVVHLTLSMTREYLSKCWSHVSLFKQCDTQLNLLFASDPIDLFIALDYRLKK